MSEFKKNIDSDLDETFFNKDEFGDEFIFGEKTIILIETDDYEVSSTKHRAFFAKTKDLVDLKDGDNLMHNNQTFRVVNFDPLYEEKDLSLIMLEMI